MNGGYTAKVHQMTDDQLLTEWAALGNCVLYNEMARFQTAPGDDMSTITRTIVTARARAEACGREAIRRKLHQ